MFRLSRRGRWRLLTTTGRAWFDPKMAPAILKTAKKCIKSPRRIYGINMTNQQLKNTERIRIEYDWVKYRKPNIINNNNDELPTKSAHSGFKDCRTCAFPEDLHWGGDDAPALRCCATNFGQTKCKAPNLNRMSYRLPPIMSILAKSESIVKVGRHDKTVSVTPRNLTCQDFTTIINEWTILNNPNPS